MNNNNMNSYNQYVAIMIPPMMDNMIRFILNDVKRVDFDKYMKWMMIKFHILHEVIRLILNDYYYTYYIS